MPLQIRRGTDAERQALIPSNGLVVGELLYVTDSQQVYIGTGNSGEHQGLAVTGYTNENAVDAVAAALTAGSHTSIAFTYGATQDNAGRIDAVVDLSDYAGTIKADAFKGSLFGDDTTLLVNAIDGTFNGNLTGNVTGNVLGNVTGVVTGNVFTNLIDSADSSAIRITPLTIFDSDVTVENELNVSKIVIDSVTHTSIGRELYPTPQTGEVLTHYLTFVDSIIGPATVKTDGDLRYTPATETLEVPTIISTTAINCPSINTTDLVAGSIRANGSLALLSTLASGADQRIVTVGLPTGTDGRFQVTTNSYFAGGLPLVNINQHHATADVVNFQFNRSRGTAIVPAAVQTGDDIADISFGGFDGGSTYKTGAAISATVDGAVSVGVVPTKLVFSTTNTAANATTAVEIYSNQQTSFFGAIKLAVYADATARDTAITAPTAGMMVFNTTSTKFQGYTGAAWVDFN